MKTLKTPLVSALLLLSFGSMAQGISQVTIAPSKNGENASAVITKVENDLNEVKPIEKGLAFMKTYPTRWKISQEQLEAYGKSDETTFTEVTTKADNETLTAVYNTKGELVKLKEVIINQPLPQSATDVINTKYNSWKVLGNIEVFNSESRKPDYIKVKLSEGIKRKVLFFDINGHELNHLLKPIGS
ncbi:hypothetical protein [Emticicia sp. SJ17W-69]|uniref:hypothetical protein n=1 Tax=Emticicia sp. SJ17W-69 TaxID=3421657 RepID=UPI003EBF523B